MSRSEWRVAYEWVDGSSRMRIDYMTVEGKPCIRCMVERVDADGRKYWENDLERFGYDPNAPALSWLISLVLGILHDSEVPHGR